MSSKEQQPTKRMIAGMLITIFFVALLFNYYINYSNRSNQKEETKPVLTSQELLNSDTSSEDTELKCNYIETKPAQLEYKEETIKLVNEKRKKYGASPVKENEVLTKLTGAKAVVYARTREWAHSIGGIDTFKLYEECGTGYPVTAEILGRKFDTPKQLVDSWEASPTHKEVMTNPDYTHFGLYIGDSSMDMYAVMIFAK